MLHMIVHSFLFSFLGVFSSGLIAQALAAVHAPQSASFGDVFRAFSSASLFLRLFLVSFVVACITIAAPPYVSLILAFFTFWFKCLLFDRDLGAWTCLRLSFRIVLKNVLANIGLLLLAALFTLLGVLAFGVGLLVALPISNLMLAHAYNDVVGIAPRDDSAQGGDLEMGSMGEAIDRSHEDPYVRRAPAQYRTPAAAVPPSPPAVAVHAGFTQPAANAPPQALAAPPQALAAPPSEPVASLPARRLDDPEL